VIISLIVAMDDRQGIGHHGSLPWRLSTDMKRFKAITMGHHLIMGRKTYETIGRLLPGRKMIIITRNMAYKADGCLIARSLEEALRLAKEGGETEVLVIGGGEIYRQALPMADRIYLTNVHTQVPADVFFPELIMNDWQETCREEISAGEKDSYPTTFRVLERKRPNAILG
jgi:dihydrofolate reductase